MTRHHTPATIRPPFTQYSHGVELPPGARILFCAGQLGVAPDDTVPEDAEAQAELCFRNIGAVLDSAGMEFGHLVRINAYVTGREHIQAYRSVRDRFVATPPPASTLLIVSGLAREVFKVEIEAIAAR